MDGWMEFVLGEGVVGVEVVGDGVVKDGEEEFDNEPRLMLMVTVWIGCNVGAVEVGGLNARGKFA
jgi:hypothetical protein